MVELNFREFGERGLSPMIILHGLLGSSRNWQMAARELAKNFHVYCLDLRNHGDSPWASPHSFEAMAEDVLAFIRAKLSAKPVLMGHSMGGKVAMKIACEYPELIEELVVVDISPKLYPKTHDFEFIGMRAVELDSLKNRTEAEKVLEAHVSDWALRKFLLTNLERKNDGPGYRWLINLNAIEPSLREIEKTPLSDDQTYQGNTIFIVGGKSRYFSKVDIPLIKRHFPACSIQVIPDCGHNPHFECRDKFVDIVSGFSTLS